MPGSALEAIRYYELGARYAAERGASRETAALVRRALALLERRAKDRHRDTLELRLLIALGNALISFEGYTAPETVRTYERARALCAELERGPHLLPVLYGLWNNAVCGGRIELASEIAAQFLTLARAHHDLGEVVALRAMAWPELLRGQFASARALLEDASRRELGENGPTLVSLFGEYPDVAAQATLAWPLWFLGETDRALRACAEAMARAESLEHPLTLSYALAVEGILLQLVQDSAAVLRSAQRAIDHATEHDLPLFAGWSLGVLGWARCETGDMQAGLTMMHESRASAEGIGARVFLTYFLALIAEQTIKAGNPAQAMEILESALAQGEDTGEHYFEAELHRLRGESLLALPRPSWHSARSAFERAVAVAQEQQTTALELRTLLSWAQAEIRLRKIDRAVAALQSFCRNRPPSDANRDWTIARDLLASLGGRTPSPK